MIAIVDTSATPTFEASKIIKEYKLKVIDSPTNMKAIKFAAHLGYGIAKNVPLTIRHWSGMHTLTVVPVYYFNILLIIEFMRKFKVSSIPHLDGLMCMGEKDPRFMNGIHHFDEKSKKNT